MGKTAKGATHLGGIDSVRFWCALTVMLGHLHPLGELLHGEGRPLVGKVLAGAFNGLFNGPAAVIVFFVVSGFCIHYPYRDGRVLTLPGYLSRRMLRIVPPAMAHLLFLRWVLGYDETFLQTMLWSVLCEVIYYVLYPALLWAGRRWGWGVLIGLAYAGAGAEIATHLGAVRAGLNQYVALGYGTWILGLPCWLVGCWLAENFRRLAVPTGAGIWGWRALLVGGFVATHVAQSHGTSVLASNCVTLDLFAPVAALCFGKEILHAEAAGTWRWAERAGRWSYSLYLVHPLVVPGLGLLGWSSFAHSEAWHPVVLGLVLGVSYLFFLVVERPSHVVAVWVGRWLEGEGLRPR